MVLVRFPPRHPFSIGMEGGRSQGGVVTPSSVTGTRWGRRSRPGGDHSDAPQHTQTLLRDRSRDPRHDPPQQQRCFPRGQRGPGLRSGWTWLVAFG